MSEKFEVLIGGTLKKYMYTPFQLRGVLEKTRRSKRKLAIEQWILICFNYGISVQCYKVLFAGYYLFSTTNVKKKKKK